MDYGDAFATVIDALPANACPMCGSARGHREGTAVLAKCAAKMRKAGYIGYDYDHERWVMKDGGEA